MQVQVLRATLSSMSDRRVQGADSIRELAIVLALEGAALKDGLDARRPAVAS